MEVLDALDSRSRRGHHPPRHQAGEHPRHHARPRQDPGLRTRQDARGGPCGLHRVDDRRDARCHRLGKRDRHAVVHVARAGSRRAGGRAHGSVLIRRGAVRDGDRRAAVSGRNTPDSSSTASSTAIRCRASRLNPDVSPGLERIIQKCLAKNRDLRYQHASDIRTDLQRLKRGHGVRRGEHTRTVWRQALDGDCSCGGCGADRDRRWLDVCVDRAPSH